jgi:4-hydroxy-3-methylbut-2-en-1-yl diphosphate synthase IspG/GcpE
MVPVKWPMPITAMWAPGVGVITLYKEKEVVKRNVPSEHAVDELIELIRQHGDWVEVTN